MTQLESQPLAVEVTDAAGDAPDLPESASRSQWQLILRRFLRHKVAVLALVILVVLYIVVMFAGSIAPYQNNPRLTGAVLSQARQGPSAKHWFGTDENGRDELTRILYAGQVSLNIGLAVAIFSSLIGVAIGSMAGYFGKLVDQILMRITDLFLVVPGLAVLAMAQMGLDGKDLPVVGKLSTRTLLIGLLSVLFWQQMARIVRGLMLSIKEKEFVEAAKASGASSARIIVRHILPNIIGPLLVNTTLLVALAIISESTLSFLGFGLHPPDVSWGVMLSAGESYVGTPQAYLIYFPGLALLLTVLCVNFLGDGLRDAFDPQSDRGH
jgi:peptide/nickel transport system permease protein